MMPVWPEGPEEAWKKELENQMTTLKPEKYQHGGQVGLSQKL